MALLVNGGFDFWFGYQENKQALIRVQQEKADAAAQRIEPNSSKASSARWAGQHTPNGRRRRSTNAVSIMSGCSSQTPAITEI